VKRWAPVLGVAILGCFWTLLPLEGPMAEAPLDPRPWGAVLVLLVFWLAREVSDQPSLAGLSAVVCSYWMGPLRFQYEMMVVPFILLFVFMIGARKDILGPALTMCILAFCLFEVTGNFHGAPSPVTWNSHYLIASTAGIAALAFYARAIRVSVARSFPHQAKATDAPASKSASAFGPGKKTAPLWYVLAGMSLTVSLLVPFQTLAFLFGILVLESTMRAMGWEVSRTQFQSRAFWACVLAVAVFAVHHMYTTGVYASSPPPYPYRDIQMLVFKSEMLSPVPPLFHQFEVEPFPTLARILGSLILLGNLIVFWKGPQDRSGPLMALGYVGSILSAVFVFDPVVFEPIPGTVVFRSLFVAGLLMWVGRELFSVASPQARQAPQRLDPAPGSLLRR